MLRRLNLSDGYEFEVQVVDERCDLGHYLGREVFGDFSGDGVGVVRLFRSRVGRNGWNGAEQPVGDVNLRGTVLGACSVLQNGGECEIETGNRGQLFAPFLGCIDVRENEDFAALEDGELWSELRLATGGHPDVPRTEAGADKGCLL